MQSIQGLIGQTLGQYRIIEQIGTGGMATVFKAYQPSLDRYVAVKVLPPFYAEQPGFNERFVREAQVIARLHHPNILPIHDFGQEGQCSYIVMQYVEGANTLREEMKRSPLNFELTTHIIGQIAAALDHAHSRRIIHRDVKPANVLMDNNWVLLSDFGLARMLETSVQLTGTGVGIGTPAYMSPEQGQALQVDHRTDIYALGIILFEMLTGQVPHHADTPLAIIMKRLNEPLPLPHLLNPAIPEKVEQVVLKALAREPNDRFESAGAMADMLREAVASLPVQVRSAPITTDTVVTSPATAEIPAGESTVAHISPPTKTATPPPVLKRRVSLPRPGLIIGSVIALLLVVIGMVIWRGNNAADPLVYDNFNNPANEKSYDQERWLKGGEGEISQQTGAMVFTQNGLANQGTGLDAMQYADFALDQPIFFEARLMLGSPSTEGSVNLNLMTDSEADVFWQSTCMIENIQGEVSTTCWETNHSAPTPNQENYTSSIMPVELNSWHTVRMEVVPSTMTWTYFIDGQSVGSNMPLAADKLKKAKFKFSIGVYASTTDEVVGYVDDVRIGPLP